MQRTDWAEKYLEEFSRFPLTWENIYRSIKYSDKTKKEVADFLLVLRNQGILISLKCQADPTERRGSRLTKWVNKKAREALKQLKGGIRTCQTKRYWCEHARRGKVSFRPKEIQIIHAIVKIETLEEVKLTGELNLEIGKVPISYFSVNDFLNIVTELRTMLDIQKYLEGRKTLPQEVLITVGIEKTIYEYYILNNGIFPYINDVSQIVDAVKNNRKQITKLIRIKSRMDKNSYIIERISDNLSQRHKDYKKGLDDRTSARYDSSLNRKNYLLMQNELCDLVLDERRTIGKHFSDIMNRVKRDPHRNLMGYKAIMLDSKPDFLYVLSASKGYERQELIKNSEFLIKAALSEYHKERGMIITHNYDVNNFEVILLEKFKQNSFYKKNGNQFFGQLNIDHIPIQPI